jgi:hypothetical protein
MGVFSFLFLSSTVSTMHTSSFRLVVVAGLITLGRTFAPPSLAKLNGLRPAAAGSNCWKFGRHQVCPKQQSKETDARDEGVERGLKLRAWQVAGREKFRTPIIFCTQSGKMSLLPGNLI